MAIILERDPTFHAELLHWRQHNSQKFRRMITRWAMEHEVYPDRKRKAPPDANRLPYAARVDEEPTAVPVQIARSQEALLAQAAEATLPERDAPSPMKKAADAAKKKAAAKKRAAAKKAAAEKAAKT